MSSSPVCATEACYVLTFSEQEKRRVSEVLDELGYADDARGLKQWVMDCLLESEDLPTSSQAMADHLSQFVAENPDQVLDMGKRVVENVKGALGPLFSRMRR